MDACLADGLIARPKLFTPTNFRVAPAAEILRPSIADIMIPSADLKVLRKIFDRLLLMASGKSNYVKAGMRNEVLGGVAFAAATNALFAMWTTAAGTDMSAYVGNTAGEVASSGAYDRVSKTNNTTNFATITGAAAKVNSNAITWVTASANWNSSANIPQGAAFDGNLKTAADNLLIWWDWTVAKPVLNGDTAQINTSGLSWTETT